MIKDIISNMTMEEKVGQMCVPILQSDRITDEIKTAVTKMGAGVIRYCPNAEFDNNSVMVGKPNKYFHPDETAEFLNSLQAITETTRHKIPLIITVDQEGGTRNDMNRGGTMVYASHMCFGVADDPELTYQIAKATAEEFRAMGVNMLQAPIADVFRYEGRKTMKAATFGEDAQKVAKHVVAMKRGIMDGNLISMIKHFPGYGSIATDAHKGTAEITKDLQTLEKEDIVPFKQAFEDGIDGVMVGHVIVKCLDDKYPATLSKIVVTDYLRGKLGFDGIVMTDAMRMRAIQDNYGTAEASVMAVQAGCDLVLLRGDFEHYTQGYEAILAAVKSGKIPMEQIDKSVERILKVKEKKGLFENRYADPQKALDIVGCEEHRKLLCSLAEKSVSILKSSTLPLKANDGKKIFVVCPEPQKIAAAMDEKQSVDMLIRAVKNRHENTTGLMVDLNPTDNQIKTAVEMAADSDIIIAATCNAILYDRQIELVNAMQNTGKTVIVVAIESPCDIEVLNNVNDYVCTYGVADDWMIAASSLMFGESSISGVPPIDMSNMLK